MKQKISLLEVCKLPDVQLHSKTAFFKSIINKQSLQAISTKDQIIRLSYTVKTIGVQGQQVGIISKRLPLKFKKPLDNQPHRQTLFQRNYVPHTSFYSQALIPIHKQKSKQQSRIQSNHLNLNLIVTNQKPQEGTFRIYKTTPLKKRAQSLIKLNTFYKKTKIEQNYNELGQITSRSKNIKNQTTAKKKSFSNLLRQCNSHQKQLINPLFHEENPFFKKIQKIKSKFSDNQIQSQRIFRYQNIQRKESITSQSQFSRPYQPFEKR